MFFYNRLNNYDAKDKPNESFNEPLSVIISAKNEAQNLEKNLPKILKQQYVKFEVVVVDDYSTDNTLAVLQKFKNEYPQLTIVEKENFKNISGKKLAISAAIEKSQHPYLFFTDADCLPNGKHWLKTMASSFNNKAIVLGYGPYLSQPGLLNKFIRYETIITAMNYFSFALAGLPYMGVGRNMAYKKELFVNSKGFTNHLNITSGDDDLFIKDVATSKNVAIVLNENTFCYSAAKNNLKAYIKQKRRHVSTSPSYQPKIKFLLSFYALSHFLIYIFIIVSFLLNILPIVFVILFAIRALIQFAIYNKTFYKLNEKELVRYITLFDCLFIGYYLISLPGVFLRNNKTWQ